MTNGADKTFQEFLGAYYGGTSKRKKRKKHYPENVVTYSKIFDNGDILVQKESDPSFEEYVVMQSADDNNNVFEEYVVQSSLPDADTDTNHFEEYIAKPEHSDSGVTDLYAVSASVEEKDVLPAEEYKIDLIGSSDNNNNPPPKPTPEAFQQSYNEPDSPPAAAYDTEVPVPSQEVSNATSKDFEEDFQAILSGKKVFDPVTKKTIDKDKIGTQQSIPSSPAATNPQVPLPADGHAIFDEIARKMQYATAYDLGVIEMDKRFNDFDKTAELQKLANAAKVKRSQAMSNTAIEQAASLKPEVDTTDFIRDLDAIKRGTYGVSPVMRSTAMDTATAIVTPNINSTEWPLRPANLRPLRMEEKLQEYGQFTYVDDPSQFNGDGIRVTNDWATQNIISVPIPQLNGKTFAGHVINNGSINFHKQGAERLRNLWAAWENAGLLDRILTFEGGYAARYIRRSAHRSPRPLSNHAWGTAFDINASFNLFGAQPALVGQRGCVRELVAIANQNGFFWGGHFLTKDGMHFELGHAV